MLHSLRRLAVFSVLFLSIGSVLGGTDAVWRWALFSRQQLLWPSLNPAARPDSARVGVLPVYLEQYSESIPCDSCHRLSQDGMEFFFGNALTRILDMALPGQPVELVAPHWDLLRSRHVTFPQDLDSLKLPWGKWLPEGEGDLIYRPKESMASDADKHRLDKMAGALGFTHLLIVRGFCVEVRPLSRSGHRGGLKWAWKAALYNARQGRFEWAMGYAEERKGMDLDEDLEPGLAKAMRKEIGGMERRAEEERKREPR